MGAKDPRIDEYIAAAAPFARPILRHVRQMIHRACPEVQETFKWSMPHFELEGPMIGLAAFKNHCSVGFWKGELIFGSAPRKEGGMGHFGRITTKADLPSPEEFIDYVRRAAELNRTGTKVPRARPAQVQKALEIPDYFAKALRHNRKAGTHFDLLSYSHRKEYLEWITGAKREETRQKRIATTLRWLAEGKTQNWKYERR